ncbi:MAG: MBL fold metallo-hydrolase [Bacteroidales bacterium]|nr:MBL fold metallo-hydrolase [Bacteroidales bacterium]
MIKKTVKMVGISIVVIIGLVLVIGVLFLNISPQFGGKPTKQNLRTFENSGNYAEGKFKNPIPTPMKMDFKIFRSLMKDQFMGNPNSKPLGILPASIPAYMNGGLKNNNTHITWFGHSSFLIQTDGMNLLLDPMFGEKPSPQPMPGPSRYEKEVDFSADDLPGLDAVIISHDHYDHLDYNTVQKIKHKVKAWYMPLGVGSHLLEWGVDPSKIHELNWGESIHIDSMILTCTPARHFSGRGLFDRFSTLWCSWVLQGRYDKIFFSGDSGYGPHFKEIGEKFGPFDLAMMECGQYDQRWSNIHMMPEESAQAAVDVKAKLFIPMHWGAFSLALHDWNDPVERVVKASQELNINIATPHIGQTFALDESGRLLVEWWK